MLHSLQTCMKLLCMNPVATESMGKKPEWSRNMPTIINNALNVAIVPHL